MRKSRFTEAQIIGMINRSASTVSREVSRNGGKLAFKNKDSHPLQSNRLN